MEEYDQSLTSKIHTNNNVQILLYRKIHDKITISCQRCILCSETLK